MMIRAKLYFNEN